MDLSPRSDETVGEYLDRTWGSFADPWDGYFHRIAHSISMNSKCFSRKVGAVLVRGKSIIATGYNGPPKGVPHCDARSSKDQFLNEALVSSVRDGGAGGKYTEGICPRRVLGYGSGEGLEYCIAAHAEVNCIADAAMLGHEVLDTTMYLTCGVPCKDCLIVLINAGIAECVCTSLERYDEETEFLLNYSSLTIREYR